MAGRSSRRWTSRSGRSALPHRRHGAPRAPRMDRPRRGRTSLMGGSAVWTSDAPAYGPGLRRGAGRSGLARACRSASVGRVQRRGGTSGCRPGWPTRPGVSLAGAQPVPGVVAAPSIAAAACRGAPAWVATAEHRAAREEVPQRCAGRRQPGGRSPQGEAFQPVLVEMGPGRPPADPGGRRCGRVYLRVNLSTSSSLVSAAWRRPRHRPGEEGAPGRTIGPAAPRLLLRHRPRHRRRAARPAGGLDRSSPRGGEGPRSPGPGRRRG
jgi:hypothetical protein